MENVSPGFIWHADDVPRLLLNGFFITVGGSKIFIRSIDTAQYFWHTRQSENDRNTVYHIGYRIAGTSDNIAKALRLANIPQNDINQILTEVISKDNYKSNPFYKEELDRLKEIRHIDDTMSKDEKYIKSRDINYYNLIKAIRLGEPWIVKLILDLNKADPRDYNNKAFHVANEIGNQEIIDMIIDNISYKNWLEMQALTSSVSQLIGPSDIPRNLQRYMKKL